MTMRSPLFLIAVALPAIAAAAAAAAEPLPLAHGTYVMAGTPCADAPFAAMRSYDGIGLGDPHSHACRARVTVRSGKRYTVANSCINAGVGPAPRSTETLRLTLHSRQTFAISGTNYRLCPGMR